MNRFFALRRLCAFVIVTCPLAIVACSQATNHPAIIGDCTGPNCVVGGGAAGSGTGGSGSDDDGSTSTGGDDGSTSAEAGGVSDSGAIGTGD